MKLNITNEKDNPLLKRKELSIDIEHDSGATPSKVALQQLLSKQLKKEPEFIYIKNIFSDKGIATSKALIFVLEEKKVEDLAKAAAAKKAEKAKEAPAEAAPAPAEGEAPKEEAKEEKPEEKKEAPKEEKKKK